MSINCKASVHLYQPDWLSSSSFAKCYTDMHEQMRLVIDLSLQNIDHKTGGPFAAAIFNEADGELISVGVNVVALNHCSMAHAEMMAISLAQQQLQQYSLGNNPSCQYRLVSSAEPCAMCASALNWSGISHLVYGAPSSAVEQIGFDEGHKPNNWIDILNAKGIQVSPGIASDAAEKVLEKYCQNNGLIYNG